MRKILRFNESVKKDLNFEDFKYIMCDIDEAGINMSLYESNEGDFSSYCMSVDLSVSLVDESVFNGSYIRGIREDEEWGSDKINFSRAIQSIDSSIEKLISYKDSIDDIVSSREKLKKLLNIIEVDIHQKISKFNGLLTYRIWSLFWSL